MVHGFSCIQELLPMIRLKDFKMMSEISDAAAGKISDRANQQSPKIDLAISSVSGEVKLLLSPSGRKHDCAVTQILELRTDLGPMHFVDFLATMSRTLNGKNFVADANHWFENARLGFVQLNPSSARSGKIASSKRGFLGRNILNDFAQSKEISNLIILPIVPPNLQLEVGLR